MDAIVPDEQRDSQAGLGLHDFAGFEQIVRRCVQDGTNVPAGYEVLKVGAAGIELHHLPDLLFERHARQQVADSLFGGQLGIFVSWHFVV